MEVNCDEFGGSYAAWGMKKSVDCRNLECGFANLGRFVEEEEEDDDFLGFGEISENNLPDDPFCMNIRSTLNSISDWLHENQIDFVSESHDNQSLFESLDWFSNGVSEVNLPEDPFCMTMMNSELADQIRFRNLVDSFSEPHDAFELVFPYLEMRDVLAVEGVCRSLRDSVRKDPFLWSTIDLGVSLLIDRVTDDSLLKLTQRAQGNLQCLNLGGCIGVTDHGLSQVLASNPRLTKLSVSGCLRLSTEGVLSTLRDLKSSNRLGVKSLITGGALYFTKEQFKELNLLLGADGNAGPKSRKKRFYTSSRLEFSLEDGRVTDLEICPRCEKPGMVFDCPGEFCPLKDHPCPKSSCRGCVVCVERCHDCGSCLNDCEHKPFCYPFSCVVCYKKSSNQLQ